MKQFMVRIIRGIDEETVDVPVTAEDESSAKQIALRIVTQNPEQWFGDLPQPRYAIDDSSDVEELDGSEYRSANL